MENLIRMNNTPCACGKVHSFRAEVVTGRGVLEKLPEFVKRFRPGKAFVLSDRNTWRVAGERVCRLLERSGVAFTSYSFDKDAPEPDEESVGAAIMHYDANCDLIIGVGSGVINDIGKILSAVSGRPYIIVATAPSMDGYASGSSSMTRSGLKISLSSRCPDVILGDTEILCQAPVKMMKSGLGDMLAKYVSICEWRIAHLVTGEYYCPKIAQLVRDALARCVSQASGLLHRDEEAVRSVFEGLVIGGVAMTYAGVSRPASGVEHYISHVLDMRSVEQGTPVEFHGIQCAVGTLIAVKQYKKLKFITPDRKKALNYVSRFDTDAWHRELRVLLGRGAESMIALEAREKKYDKDLHKARLDVILANWQEILQIVEEELPATEELEALMDTIGMPKTLSQIGTEESLLPIVFRATKDIRDKYVLSRLLWDLGLLEELVK